MIAEICRSLIRPILEMEKKLASSKLTMFCFEQYFQDYMLRE
ncbi:hypothetical protein APHWI1_0461 [Anaplasma phagocytophilum str. ApWI1]|uniref:Uncharacterized protein n=1 Tax=Anaplasma phagocytophilum str. ApWI1 TaxID=1359155 RepID=A0A0F3PYE2_ANAPH|nr:hypothetical protein APHWEB_1051 [Anaplasma phagocytophilum str. Webster]KJV82220.1 hypothetical protein APHHGE2_1258 [Anaplasma phagocytophilum str. HGE2]KJV85293.1 hypothetical protein APHWI1_0461 [Anaplasma phagocytophilum str. ApWI1]KJV86874.1 hypothetical protein APHNYW_0972 [Anaplasma phagocytophilum str. ApNYW]KJV98215.1 hypothetical protein OTSANNIE_1229 [Anaplasma phagocytophilum str. Annie]KKA00369.1 hypothetical protein APHDU1_0247 [Anaplasma phagocytophilum]